MQATDVHTTKCCFLNIIDVIERVKLDCKGLNGFNFKMTNIKPTIFFENFRNA